MRIVELFVAVFAAFLTSLAIHACVTCEAWGSDTTEAVSAGIVKLQPAHDPQYAAALAEVFVEAGEAHEVDPLLLVAIAMRESSLRPGIRGAVGEIGLLQVHGAALGVRPKACPATLDTWSCEVHTGAAWLKVCQEVCPGSTARWLAAYGSGKCPAEDAATKARGILVVRRYYETIGGTGWE